MRTNILQAKKALLVLFVLLLPLVASAAKVEIDGIWYNLVSKAKQAEVTYKGDSYDSYDDKYSGSITLPATVTHNGVAYSVTRIGEWAFYSCSSLTTITIPEGVTSIGNYAFYYCFSLTTITCEAATPPAIGNSYTFYGVDKSIPVYVPAGSVETYKSAYYWSEFTNFIGVGTTGIDNSQFTIDNGKFTIHDLQGRKVTDTEDLKGIYLIDGRKVIIK